MAETPRHTFRQVEGCGTPTIGESIVPSWRIREIETQDDEAIADVVRIHMQFLAFGPIAGLGETFVRKIGYAAPMKDGNLRVAVCEVEGRIGGYIAFTSKAHSFQTETIRRHWQSVAWILASHLICYPSRLGSVVRAIKAAASHQKESDQVDHFCGEVAALAVRPEYATAEFFRRTRVRVSEELVKYAAAGLKGSGMQRLRTYVDADNRSVIMIYNRFGAHFETLRYGGVPTLRVLLDLDRNLRAPSRTISPRTGANA